MIADSDLHSSRRGNAIVFLGISSGELRDTRSASGYSSLVFGISFELAAVAPTPIRAAKTEALLAGKSLTQKLVKEAGAMAGSESSPITDQRSSGEYRRWIVEALTRRGLEQCWQAITGKEVA